MMTQPREMHPFELYMHPLAATEFSVAGHTIELKLGRIQTIDQVDRMDARKIESIASSVTGVRSPRRAVEIVKYVAQIEWYRAKGHTIPSAVQSRYDNLITEARVSDQEQEQGRSDTTDEQQAGTTGGQQDAPTTKRKTGIRPFIDSLIAQIPGDGIIESTDEIKKHAAYILAAAREKFPDAKPVQVSTGVVMGQMRLNGRAPWTPRKGNVG